MHSLLILTHIKENILLSSVDIIEIGGGYGGLCFFLHKMAPLLDIKISSYTIFDLPEVIQLQEKYLKSLQISNVNYCHLNKFEDLKSNSFLVSNYAFSEISKVLQEQYIDKIIKPYVTNGFLAWNCIPVYKFCEQNITKEKEFPLTHETNFYVKF